MLQYVYIWQNISNNVELIIVYKEFNSKEEKILC